MKKLMYVAVFGMALGLTSCGADDVLDVLNIDLCAANTTEVTEANAAFAAEATPNTCEALKSAIEDYKFLGCGDSFDAILANLPADCSSL